jgi:hypothetical protein
MPADYPSLFLLLQGLRFPVASATEAGLSIGAAALGATAFPGFGRHAVLQGVLEVREGGAEDHYEVTVRPAGARGGSIELAFVELSAELRGRLRSLAAASEPEDPAEPRALPLAFARATEAPASGGRRLILPGSAPLWATTAARRSAFRRGEPHPPPETSTPEAPSNEAPPSPAPPARPRPDWTHLLVLALLGLAILVWMTALLAA